MEWHSICPNTHLGYFSVSIRHWSGTLRTYGLSMTSTVGCRIASAKLAAWNQELAAKLGAIGLVGRASGVSCDLRVDHPWPPYDRLNARLVTQTSGDVAARVQVRFDEIVESLRLCRMLLEDFSSGPIRTEVPLAEPDRLGIGLIEGWRGPVMIALETGRTEPSGAAMPTIPRGRTGRFSNMRSSATSFPTSP